MWETVVTTLACIAIILLAAVSWALLNAPFLIAFWDWARENRAVAREQAEKKAWVHTMWRQYGQNAYHRDERLLLPKYKATRRQPWEGWDL